MICIICKEEFYRQTETDPAEPCLCGEMAWGSLYNWGGYRAYLKRFKYWSANQCFKLGNYLISYKVQ